MFRIIQGPMGAGKTFYAVNYLKKFAHYDKIYDTMILDTDVLLITNIDTIRVQHMTVKDFREQDFLDPDKLKQYVLTHGYKRIIYIHDEAQKIYGGMKDNKEFFFLEYSRHLGMDVFFIVQTVSALPRRLVELAEYIMDAKPRTLGVMGFQYEIKDTKYGNKIGTVTIKKDVDVFRLYKSFDLDELDKAKPQKLILRKLVVGGVIMCLSLVSVAYLVKFAMTNQLKDHEKKTPKTAQAASINPELKPVKREASKGAQETKQDSSGVVLRRGIEQVYVLYDRDVPVRPGGKIKGVSHTDRGTYVFYE